MPQLSNRMPPIALGPDLLLPWGQRWSGVLNEETGKAKQAACFDRHQSVNFPRLIDNAVASALAAMLGDVPVLPPISGSLLPPNPNCVELGGTRIVGGIRPQNYDVAYRPDGPRIVFDSKTLNDRKSVGKNWQNMINDLATEAATVHTRFPYCLVAFVVAIPRPALGAGQELTMIRTLERLALRKEVLDEAHLAEAISLVIWNPQDGLIDDNIPPGTSNLRIEKFSETLFPTYVNRYKGLPPHD